MDTLYGIAPFVEAVNAGSFAAAAHNMHLSRSAVGKVIARLEQQLGVHLFQRTTRTLRLTEAGEVYFAYCQRALAELAAARSLLDTGKSAPAGRLKVTAPLVYGRLCVMPVLLALLDSHPALSLEMSLSDRPLDLHADGFDLAIRIGRLPDSTTLAARQLGTQQLVVCAAPAYIARHGAPASLSRLAGHTAIMYASHGALVPWRLRAADGTIAEADVQPRLLFDDLQAMADAAGQGAGLAMLPDWLVRPKVARGELVVLVGSDEVVAEDIHAIWPAARHLAPKTRAAIDALVAGLDRVP